MSESEKNLFLYKNPNEKIEGRKMRCGGLVSAEFINYAKVKTVQSIERVEKAIRDLVTANESINAARVAERSGVSRQWIYKNEVILN